MDTEFYLFSLYREGELVDHGRIGVDGESLEDILCRYQAMLAYGATLYVRDGKKRQYVLSDWNNKILRTVTFG